jgi:hypothetical protein
MYWKAITMSSHAFHAIQKKRAIEVLTILTNVRKTNHFSFSVGNPLLRSFKWAEVFLSTDFVEIGKPLRLLGISNKDEVLSVGDTQTQQRYEPISVPAGYNELEVNLNLPVSNYWVGDYYLDVVKEVPRMLMRALCACSLTEVC